MNFFKSVFADDPDPSNPEPESDPDPKPQQPSQSDPSPSAWNFGDLIKTIATKSETVIETYRRDLQEFGSGLKKEIEVAQGSLETVGTVIDDFGNTVIKSTAQIISQGTDAILADDHESDSSDSNNNNNNQGPTRSLGSNKYSRFDAQVRAVQGDVSTYVEEPEDSEEYGKWKGEFVLEEKREEIEGLLLEENGVMESVYKRVVPSSVDHETFWLRYFFRVYKLKQAENVRAKLVKRAISVEDEEELSWDVDDDDDDDDDEGVVKMDVGEVVRSGNDAGEKSSTNVVAAEEANVAAKSEDAEGNVVKEESSAEKLQSNVVDEKEKSAKIDTEKKGSVVEVSGDKGSEKKDNVEGESEKKDLPAKLDEKAAPVVEVKEEVPACSKGSEVSGVASVASEEEEEEDLGWDEIEDLSSIEEKKVNPGASGGSANRAELQKRLSTAQEEEEDLSWDIEDDDDDEPSKA